MPLWLPALLAELACLGGVGLVAALEAALHAHRPLRGPALVGRPLHPAPPPRWRRHLGLVLAALRGVRLGLGLAAGFVSLALRDRLGWQISWGWLCGAIAAAVVLLSEVLPRLLARRLAWTSVSGALAEAERRAAEAHGAGLGEGGEDLLLSILKFSDTVIREIMVPRTATLTVSLTSSLPELQAWLLEAGHSRLPVFDETVDNIVGILHIKDLLLQIRNETAATRPPFDLRALLRPTFYVPEIMKISELLREFQRRKTHMAIVVDEYGGTAGVVTLEDIIEEIVGEIQDEYDVEEKQFRLIGDKIIADGRVSIWDLEAALQVEFPNDAEYETLAGFLMSRLGLLPKAGMVINWNNLRFTVKEANEKRIRTVEIERANKPAPA